MFDSLIELLSLQTLFNLLWATFGGIVIGALPGLTATMGLALMTSLTYSIEGKQAILVLICPYIGAIYGGSRSAILLNIPGTPANAATAIDGHFMALSGDGHQALGLATVASLTGMVVGGICLILIAPLLAEFALGFGSYEYFLLGFAGILIAGKMTSADDPLKGWIAGFIGLAVSMVGQEAIHSYPLRRCEIGRSIHPTDAGRFRSRSWPFALRRYSWEIRACSLRWAKSPTGSEFRLRAQTARGAAIGVPAITIPGLQDIHVCLPRFRRSRNRPCAVRGCGCGRLLVIADHVPVNGKTR